MLSYADENDLMDLLMKFKEEHRVRNAIVVIMTDERIIINPSTKKFKSVEHEEGYGEGFADGRNDLFKEMNYENYGKIKKRRNIFD